VRGAGRRGGAGGVRALLRGVVRVQAGHQLVVLQPPALRPKVRILNHPVPGPGTKLEGRGSFLSSVDKRLYLIFDSWAVFFFCALSHLLFLSLLSPGG